MGTVLGLVLDLGVDGSVLVQSKCLDNQMCFTPKHLGSVLVWNRLIGLNRVLETLENLQYRVKSGKFGHQVNSDIFANSGDPDEPSHQDFHGLLS